MVGYGVGAGSESGLELEISSTLAFPSRISISGLSLYLTSIIRLVWSGREGRITRLNSVRGPSTLSGHWQHLSNFPLVRAWPWLIVNWEQKQKSHCCCRCCCCCCGSLEETPQLAQMGGLRGQRAGGGGVHDGGEIYE